MDELGNLFRERFPNYTDEQIHHLIDMFEQFQADAAIQIFEDVCRQAEWEEQYTGSP